MWLALPYSWTTPQTVHSRASATAGHNNLTLNTLAGFLHLPALTVLPSVASSPAWLWGSTDQVSWSPQNQTKGTGGNHERVFNQCRTARKPRALMSLAPPSRGWRWLESFMERGKTTRIGQVWVWWGGELNSWGLLPAAKWSWLDVVCPSWSWEWSGWPCPRKDSFHCQEGNFKSCQDVYQIRPCSWNHWSKEEGLKMEAETPSPQSCF